jgi:hypothetical protein
MEKSFLLILQIKNHIIAGVNPCSTVYKKDDASSIVFFVLRSGLFYFCDFEYFEGDIPTIRFNKPRARLSAGD